MGSLLSEEVAVVATVDPDALTATDHDSDWVDMGTFQQIMAVAMVGTLGTSATVDVSVRQATDSSGTSAKAITGKSATQLTQAGTDDDKQVVINVRADELDVANDFTHVSLRITVGTATSDGGGVVLARRARRQPASENDLASVDEIVS